MDISKSLHNPEFYFEGNNIRIVATDSKSTGSVTNEKGNTLVTIIPTPIINSETNTIDYSVFEVLKSLPYDINGDVQPRNEIESSYYISDNVYKTSGEQRIIGHGLVRDAFIVFSTDNNGFDCIWKVSDKSYDIELLYMRNMGFNEKYPIQCINNYENKIIDKIYWVNGKNQMCFINIYHSTENQDLENLIDLNFDSIQMVGTFELDQPEIIDIASGGIHTSGMIQYAYNLYRINGSQTKISPLTELIPLNKEENNGGGDLNEIVGTIPVIKIDNLDSDYTNLKLYAIKYTSYNQVPQVSLILDRDITTVDNIIYYDDGNIIEDLSLEEFLFLGSDIVIPKHINTKKNYMFLANYSEKNFDVSNYDKENSIDLRAYSFPINSNTTNIYDNLEEDNSGTIISSEPPIVINQSVIDNITKVPYKHSSININYDTNSFQFNNNILGGEGAYIKYRIVRNQIGINEFSESDSKGKFLKDNEVYRLAIQFYNKYGQNSLPKWIADFKNIILNNQSNLNGYYASIEITLKPSFYIWLNDNNNFLDENGLYDDFLKPVGYRLLRAERTLLDRTILCQGILNGMMGTLVDRSGDNVTPDQIAKVNAANKIPSMMRRFDEYLCPQRAMETYARLDRFDSDTHPQLVPGGYSASAGNEVYKSPASSGWTFGTFQFNKLMQLFSPEITFNTIQTLNQTKLRVIGGVKNDYNAYWGQRRSTGTQIIDEAKVFNAISIHDVKSRLSGNLINIAGVGGELSRFGWFGPRADTVMEFSQTYRKYTGTYLSAYNEYDIYGSPEITNLGQGRTPYNDDNELIYYNSLQQLATDTGEGSADNPNTGLDTVNTYGAKTITLALGNDNLLTQNRKGLEDLYTESNINDTSVGMLGELVIDNNLIYLGNIYGGNTYESKKRSNYIEVGNYNPIDNNIYNCLHLGDTFVSNFRFTKLVKTETEVYSDRAQQVTEIVEFKVETTIDLKNRSDLSLTEWDNRFQPRYDEYQKYNTVYSQDNNLIIRKDLDYKFKTVNSFDTNIIASKVKVAGEIIDSWTDLQVNNTMTLNGKYGPINSLHEFRGELFTFQDSALAAISILPRVQIPGNDGISIELGNGSVLQEYNYISTNSGTKNKWSIVNSPTSVYYYDSLNNSINIYKGGIGGLTDSKGLHTYLNNNITENLITDNPFIKTGISSSFDYINNDVLFTFLQFDKSFTVSYNEGTESFTSFYDYKPSMYISRGNNLITTDPTNTKLYKQYQGNYNQFYDTYYPSNITLLVNPQPDNDTVFDNIEYKTEVYLDNVDQPNITLSKVQLYSEYQNSGLVPIVPGRQSNARRRFRDWNVMLPREENTRNRIRNPWVYLKVQFDNENNYKLILHSIIVSYSV